MTPALRPTSPIFGGDVDRDVVTGGTPYLIGTVQDDGKPSSARR